MIDDGVLCANNGSQKLFDARLGYIGYIHSPLRILTILYSAWCSNDINNVYGTQTVSGTGIMMIHKPANGTTIRLPWNNSWFIHTWGGLKIGNPEKGWLITNNDFIWDDLGFPISGNHQIIYT